MMNSIEELINNALKVKARMHLDKSRVISRHIVTDDVMNYSSIDMDKVSREEVVSKTIREAISNYSNLISKERNCFGTEYSLDLMVLPTDVFKECLIQFIADMPIEEILKIRGSRK